MSIFKPTMAITRYKVSGIPETDGKDPIKAMMDIFTKDQIVDISDGEDVSWGWTKLTDPYCPKFDDITFITGSYVTVGLRVDKKSVPAAALKKEVYIAEKKEMEEKQIPKLARTTKVMIKEAVLKNMLAKAPVVPATFDVVWNVSDMEIYLFSTNKLARNVLEDIIHESFDLSIEMVFPFTMAEESVNESELVNLAQTVFA